MFEPLDYDETQDDRRPKRSRQALDVVWNVLTVLVLLVLLVLLGVFTLIFFNPYAGLNPFPPPTLPVALGFPTATPTLTGYLPPTWTPIPTLEPTPTETTRPTATVPPTPTNFSLVSPTEPPPLPTSTEAPEGYPFVLQQGSPKAIANIAHPELGCNWMGVAGQVLDLSGGPKTQLIVVLGGTIGGNLVDSSGSLYSLTGLATQYGQAGYEFVLASQPIASDQTMWIQLVDQSGYPLSERVYITTYQDCEKNLVLINFKQVR